MLNLNIGILGHVDSGKTSLAKVLSKTASTAAFDKNPQSQERGITLDLGFSSFTAKPKHLSDEIQFTLVDCPGHASLIRTIIGGAQIIDMMLLVIDITKGIQTQTAECLVIGEITCKKMIIVLNKIDQLRVDKQKQSIEKMIKKLRTTLSNTIFKDVPFVAVAANPEDNKPQGIDELKQIICEFSCLPQRTTDSPFLFFVDHCFGIKGQGTVMTGTILQGSTQINDMVEIPLLNVTKKIKSIQMFRQPIHEAKQGDRVGICVTQFDPKLFERGIVCAPNFAIMTNVAIISAEKVRYFKFPIKTNSKCHITVGHETIMATITNFCINKDFVSNNEFNFDLEYRYCDELSDLSDDKENENICNYLLLEFEKPILVVPKCLVMGSKLDLDVNENTCRIAFWGALLETTKDKNYKVSFLPRLKIFKDKNKTGIIERLVNDNEIIIKDMFKKETNVQKFIGLNIKLSTGETGRIESQFGQSGKIKVCIPTGLNAETAEQLRNTKKSKNEESKPIKVTLQFKRYIYDSHKKIIQ